MGDDRTFQFGNPAEGNISSPDIIPESGVEDFNRLLPDLLCNFGPQDEDSFTFDFSHSNADGTMSESMTPPYQISSLVLKYRKG